MAETCTVLIAAADLLTALMERAGAVNGEVLTFSDAEPLRALEAIVRRRPHVVALERLFAASPRGTALINRIKADRSLVDLEIRVLSHNTDYSRVVPRMLPVATPPLDQRGTRRAPRFKMAADVPVLVEGKSAKLVDLSTVGAHLLSPAVLKPNQTVMMALKDSQGSVQFNATIVWASIDISPAGGAQYRAGADFVDADGGAVDAFCTRHRQA